MTGQMRNEKLPALAEALSGMRFGPQHAHAAASLLRATGLLDAGLPELQERVTAHLAAIPASRGADCDGATGPGAGWAGGPAAERLNEIPGPGREAAAALIAETGLDTSRFPAAEALASRAGLTRPQISPAPARAAGRRATATPAPKRIGPGRLRGGEHGHVPARALPPSALPSRRGREGEGRLRRGPFHPGHRAAPAQRPRRPLPRPRTRLARQAQRPQPQRPQRPPPARGPRQRRHHHPPGGRRLIQQPATTAQPSRRPRAALAAGPSHHARNCGHTSGIEVVISWPDLRPPARVKAPLTSTYALRGGLRATAVRYVSVRPGFWGPCGARTATDGGVGVCRPSCWTCCL
jgi:hypothetical protein